MAISIKNEWLSKGMFNALNAFINVKFPEGMGDVCWELALASVEIEKQSKAHDKIIEKYQKVLNDGRKEVLKKYYNEGTEEFRGTSEEEKKATKDQAIKDPGLISLVEQYNKEITALKDMEITYNFNRIIIKKSDLKKLELQPVILSLLLPILDIRD